LLHNFPSFFLPSVIIRPARRYYDGFGIFLCPPSLPPFPPSCLTSFCNISFLPFYNISFLPFNNISFPPNLSLCRKIIKEGRGEGRLSKKGEEGREVIKEGGKEGRLSEKGKRKEDYQRRKEGRKEDYQRRKEGTKIIECGQPESWCWQGAWRQPQRRYVPASQRKEGRKACHTKKAGRKEGRLCRKGGRIVTKETRKEERGEGEVGGAGRGRGG
jgi:hypothetical protein